MKKEIILTAFIVWPGLGWAADLFGPSTGGGGFAVVCPATPLEPASVELLDLYEGRGFGFKIAQPTGSLLDDYYQAVDRTYTAQGAPDLAEELRGDVEQNVKNFFRSTKFVENEAELPKANDLGKVPWIPSQCSLKQIAYFEDSKQIIHVLKPLFDQMDSVSQSALVHHEIFYREYRGLQDLDSTFSRRTVAHIYAVAGRKELKEGVVPGVSRKFGTNSVESRGYTELSITPMVGVRDISRLQFTYLEGRAMLTQSYADVSRLPTLKRVGVNCVVQDDVSLRQEVPLRGTQLDGYILQVDYAKDLPITLTLLKDGVSYGVSTLDGGRDCSGAAL